MDSKNNDIRKELWFRQQIKHHDVDYNIWEQKRMILQQSAEISRSCFFTVDVYKGRYDFASQRFTDIFGYKPFWIKNIRKMGDILEDRIHPDDYEKMICSQIKHSKFIYSLPACERNDFQSNYQFRIFNAKRELINVISRQQVIQTDCNGKAWMIMGVMDVSPDQVFEDAFRHSVVNLKTGEIIKEPEIIKSEIILTQREKEILYLINQGFLSKEIAEKLNLSIHTINNHRKNILIKLKADNAIEALNAARKFGMIQSEWL